MLIPQFLLNSEKMVFYPEVPSLDLVPLIQVPIDCLNLNLKLSLQLKLMSFLFLSAYEELLLPFFVVSNALHSCERCVRSDQW